MPNLLNSRCALKGKLKTRKELKKAFTYIVLMGLFIWTPLVYLVLDLPVPFLLFEGIKEAGAAAMFLCGSVIANATSIGGGIVFNPTLQFVFGVTGYSALVLSILVQATGMASGSFGWYAKGEYAHIHRPHLLAMVAVTIGSTLIWSCVFLLVLPLLPKTLPIIMKIATVFISVYVAFLVWRDIKQSKEREPVSGRVHEQGSQKCLHVDGRIWGWLVLGSLLNVYTAVGSGMLLFSHLITYYKTAPKTAVAAGTLIQMSAVVTQSLFILLFLRHLIEPELVLIGVFVCLVGGRLAPLILTRPSIEPYVKHILLFTALAMSLVSGILLLPVLMGFFN